MRKHMYDNIMKRLSIEIDKNSYRDAEHSVMSKKEVLELVERSIKLVMAEMILNGTYYSG